MKAVVLEDNIQHLVLYSCNSRTFCGIIISPGMSIFDVKKQELPTNCPACKNLLLTEIKYSIK